MATRTAKTINYKPSEIEEKWQKEWSLSGMYEPDLEKSEKPFFNLMMFPYPSAEGLHVGNMYAFTGADVYGRYMRLRGFDVFEPIGLDGFGIHSENYALKVNSHPMEQAQKSEENFYRQLSSIGNSFAWGNRLETYDIDYYRWTQWLFVQLFKAGLAYKGEAQVNWCPSCKTVLADEQVIEGKCERCGTEVEKKMLAQWFFRITEYAERLLVGLESIDWTDKVKTAQRNWIGKSEGARIRFPIKDLGFKLSQDNLKFAEGLIPLILGGEKTITYRLEPKDLKEGDAFELINAHTKARFAVALVTKVEKKKIKDISEKEEGHEKFASREDMYQKYSEYYKKAVNDETDVWIYRFSTISDALEVFTTRPDTLYGATFMVISPEHPLALKIGGENKEVMAYIQQSRKKSDKEKREEKEKTGVFTGSYCINPVNSKQLPIWIADYVLMGYGTGAIMAVPAHDPRDFEFAKKYDLPTQSVIEPKFVTREGDGALREGEKIVKREAVCILLKNPKDGKYLCISWKEFVMNGLVTGGMEEGEDMIEAARREIQEETGYKNVRFINDPQLVINTFFYQRQKKHNRWARFHYLEFELEDEERVTVSEAEKKAKDVVWKDKEELSDFFTVSEGTFIVDYLVNGQSAYTGPGILGNSGDWDGLEMPQDISKVINWLEERGIGKREITYHLRDWLISRQRYWGPPIPMIYCEACAKEGKSWFTSSEYSEYADGKKVRVSEDQKIRNFDSSEPPIHGQVESSEFTGNSGSWAAGWYPEENLPVELPFIDDYKPLGTGKSPLGNHPEFYETRCPHCGGKAARETDVSDTFLDSSWYFLRYLATDLSSIPFPMDKHVTHRFADVKDGEVEKAEKRVRFLPVAQYTGGAEHSVLHLLYTRFFYKVLSDLGYIDKEKLGDEPFPKFFAHGLIIKDGAKMSKSKGNVVIPDAYIKKYGADALRTYLMFLGPFSGGGDFRDSGIEGMHKFLKRVWVMGTGKNISSTPLSLAANSALHKAIKGVGGDISAFRYNTAIAKIMTLYNYFSQESELNKQAFLIFLQLLAPFAPHMTEELWEIHGGKGSIHTSSWPEYDREAIVEEEVIIAIQVNGKLRDSLTVSKDSIEDQEQIESQAREAERVKKYLEGKEVKKTIYVPGKILNFVVH